MSYGKDPVKGGGHDALPLFFNMVGDTDIATILAIGSLIYYYREPVLIALSCWFVIGLGVSTMREIARRN